MIEEFLEFKERIPGKLSDIHETPLRFAFHVLKAIPDYKDWANYCYIPRRNPYYAYYRWVGERYLRRMHYKYLKSLEAKSIYKSHTQYVYEKIVQPLLAKLDEWGYWTGATNGYDSFNFYIGHGYTSLYEKKEPLFMFITKELEGFSRERYRAIHRLQLQIYKSYGY